MKAFIFFITIFFFSSSSAFISNHGEETKKEAKASYQNSKDVLYAMVGYLCYCEDLSVKVIPFPGFGNWGGGFCPEGDFPLEEMGFTDNNIKSFNIATKEIVFIDYDPPLSKGFSIYLNDDPILENIAVFPINFPFLDNDLVLYYDYGFFFIDGYPPNISSWLQAEREGWQEKRDKNSEKRKEGWDIFIQHLRNTGKIIGENTNVESIIPPELNNIEIYPNPTTGELRIRKQRSALANYETTFSASQLGIEGVEIYDIMGKKLSTVNYQLSTVNSIDISQLPAGIYFVRITTEKGVVTKKVVKK